MTPGLEAAARTLAVRLRLNLVDLADVERWADEAILNDDGAHPELVELCLARSEPLNETLTRLETIGAEPTVEEIVAVLAQVNPELGMLRNPEQLEQFACGLDGLLSRFEYSEIPAFLAEAKYISSDFSWARSSNNVGQLMQLEKATREFVLAARASHG